MSSNSSHTCMLISLLSSRSSRLYFFLIQITSHHHVVFNAISLLAYNIPLLIYIVNRFFIDNQYYFLDTYK